MKAVLKAGLLLTLAGVLLFGGAITYVLTTGVSAREGPIETAFVICQI